MEIVRPTAQSGLCASVCDLMVLPIPSGPCLLNPTEWRLRIVVMVLSVFIGACARSVLVK